MKSLLAKPVAPGHREIESTDHFEGTKPVSLKVRPDPKVAWYIIAMLLYMSSRLGRAFLIEFP